MRNPESFRRFLTKSGARATVGSVLFNDFWNADDRVVNVLQRLAAQGALEATARGKLGLKTVPFNSNIPWFFIRPGMFRDCLVWHQMYFDNFGFIHSGCQNCWKCVVVTNPDPSKQTVLDLFKLRDLFVELALPSKVGADLRDYTPHRYDGFVYGDSLEQGLKYYKILTQALGGADLPDAKVILKRGCTEMELMFPDSTLWKHTPASKELEMRLDYIVDRTQAANHGQDDITKQTVFRRWILRAYGIGDPTWKDALIYEGYEVPDGPLFLPPVTYHDKDPEWLKEKLQGQQDLSFLDTDGG